jgi:hypothetical protein
METVWELLTKILDTRLICCKRYWVHPGAFDEGIEHILELLMGNWIHFEAADESFGYTLELLMRDLVTSGAAFGCTVGTNWSCCLGY